MNQIIKFKFIFKEVLKIFGIFILAFGIFRISIYLSYPELFEDLSFTILIESIFLGLRFDVSSISLILFIPVLLLIFPIKATNNLTYRRIIYSIIYLELVLTILFLASDHIYFSFVKRHITNELLFLINDTEYLMTEVSVKLLPIMFIFTLTIVTYPLFIKITCSKKKESHRSVFCFIIIFLLIILAGRGGFQRKPIAVIDAYQYGSASQGHLILNGIKSTMMENN